LPGGRPLQISALGPIVALFLSLRVARFPVPAFSHGALGYTRAEKIAAELTMASLPTPQANDLHAKALAINLEASIYGTFAEIGAGQEVARWFLSVGAASGTVAQAISAYDKTVSDDTYGAGTRYVSKERLVAMLDHEYQLLLDRLAKERGDRSRFFVFADTVATRNYQGTNEQHGWLGLRFQAEPGGQPNQILMHINMKDSTALLQQQAIGFLGVNLIYAAYHQRSSAETFLTGLFEDLTPERIEIDVLELTGPVFAGTDSRLWSLELLRRGVAEALVFDSHAQLAEPSTPLRKRPLILERVALNELSLFAGEPLEAARKQYLAEGQKTDREPAILLELSMQRAGEAAGHSNSEMLAGVEKLAPLGTVVVTQYREGYRLADYLRRHTEGPIRVVVSIATLIRIFGGQIYGASPGAVLETFGRLLVTDVTIYVAPMRMEPFVAALGGLPGGFVVESAASDWMTLDDFLPKPPVHHLFQYLRAAGRVVPLAIQR
jgi:hypothetical protein